MTSTVPEPAGAVAVMVVAPLTVKFVAWVAPKATAVAPVKLVPLTVTGVPPAAAPELGVRPLTVGASVPPVNVNWSLALVALVPPAVTTVASTVPDPGGVVTVMEVALFTVKAEAGIAPKSTSEAPVRLVPVKVTEVPPALGPDAGVIPVTVGAGGGVPEVMETFLTVWTSVSPPVPPVNPTSTDAGRLVA